MDWSALRAQLLTRQFGEAWRSQRVVVYKREKALIDKMRKLRAQGLSYGKIADVLNGWGIKTKTGKAKWSAKTVHQILNRKSHKN